MVDETFRLPLSSYEQLVRVIRAYANMDQPASPDDVGKAAALHATIVSRNNAFLVAVGILQRGAKKVLTDNGRALARALEYDRTPDIGRLWRELVTGNEFLSKLVTAVRIRDGMEASTLQAHIAYSAGQPRKKDVMTGAGAIVDLLKAAELIREDDGKLVATQGAEESVPEDSLAVQPREPSKVQTVQSVRVPIGIVKSPTGISIQIQLQIQVAPNELEELAVKLRSLIDGLTESKDAEPPSG